MNLVSLRLITHDVRRPVTFYERVTGVTATWSNDDFAELVTSSGILAIGSTGTVALFGAGSVEPAAHRSAIVEFLVSDVDARFDEISDWVEDLVAAPTTLPWGNRSLLVRDPDGTLVNLFTPVSPEAVEKFSRYDR